MDRRIPTSFKLEPETIKHLDRVCAETGLMRSRVVEYAILHVKVRIRCRQAYIERVRGVDEFQDT